MSSRRTWGGGETATRIVEPKQCYASLLLLLLLLLLIMYIRVLGKGETKIVNTQIIRSYPNPSISYPYSLSYSYPDIQSWIFKV